MAEAVAAPSAGEEPPLSRVTRPGGLPRSISWRSSVVLAVGASLQITVVMAAMVGDLGNLHVLVWSGAALVGLVQCFLIAELARYAPGRAGGVAAYAQEALGRRAPWLAALSGWGYWFAWTPGIAVSLYLAAQYLQDTIAPGVSPLAMALVLGILLYSANALGLRNLMGFSTVMLGVAGLILVALLVAPLLRPSLFTASEVWPLRMPDTPPAGGESTLALFIKWAFVATWSAYAAEIAASVVAEMRDATRVVMRALLTAGVVCLLAFTAVPFVMTGIAGVDGLGESPTTVFLAPAEAVFGSAGRVAVGVMLACALVLGAQAYLVASSRAVYQMSRDAYLPKVLSRVNRFGVPYLSILCDACVIGALLLVFGADLVDVIASANIGYLVVFVLVPVSFVIVRIQRRRAGRPRILPPAWTVVGGVIVVLNAALLVVGALLWGTQVWMTGVVVMLLLFPLMLWRRWRDQVEARKLAATGPARPEPGSVEAPPFPASAQAIEE